MKLKKLNEKSGFTLLEIIVVIIIVGVLASLALPKLFSTVEFSRSAEALNTFGTIKRQAEACTLMSNSQDDYTDCITWAEIGLDDPADAANAHFGYTVSWATPDFIIVAQRNTVDGGDDTAGVNTITYTLETDNAVVIRSGTGTFSNIK